MQMEFGYESSGAGRLPFLCGSEVLETRYRSQTARKRCLRLRSLTICMRTKDSTTDSSHKDNTGYDRQ